VLRLNSSHFLHRFKSVHELVNRGCMNLEKNIGSLYSLPKNAEIKADVNSKLYYLHNGSWIESRGGNIRPRQMKGVETIMELHQDKMIDTFAIRNCSIMMDYMLNSGSPSLVAGMIRQHGTVENINGCTQASLKVVDLIQYIRPISEAIFEQCMNEIARPWGPDSAKKLFSLIRTNPTFCNRALLIYNVVIRDEFGSQLFKWDE